MTRKDYTLIAEALRDVVSSVGDSDTALLNAYRYGMVKSAEAIAVRLASDNPRFDRKHFLAVVRGERELGSKPEREKQRWGWNRSGCREKTCYCHEETEPTHDIDCSHCGCQYRTRTRPI